MAPRTELELLRENDALRRENDRLLKNFNSIVEELATARVDLEISRGNFNHLVEAHADALMALEECTCQVDNNDGSDPESDHDDEYPDPDAANDNNPDSDHDDNYLDPDPDTDYYDFDVQSNDADDGGKHVEYVQTKPAKCASDDSDDESSSSDSDSECDWSLNTIDPVKHENVTHANVTSMGVKLDKAVKKNVVKEDVVKEKAVPARRKIKFINGKVYMTKVKKEEFD